ncbi:sugar ABC transporter substrate-binding protein [Paenibacillus pasadenensis]|uniref:N-Acetyl-D-glucosamine ABC transport system, sugar-binding protein n=1 Tax=Paenibacillus pasadenensis TaxID=217090 RepID=A0A2N5NA19_9BACL|nr:MULTISPECIES: sugar ABC transporter substrate-binding protein [Paenibacillus]PLT47158.1 N-Acetyl-D-glucosamine ABC transport system, sugar-binding protein [Paenibacillus pasadenensis]QGG57482.1 extracellular solute-binding protein [Paenibacillus sp. B01]
MDTKRTIAALAAAALAGSLIAGCSSGGSGAEEGKTKLTVWAMGDSSKPMEQMAAAYQKENPDVSIQVQAIPWGSAHDKLLTAVASKKGPDVLQMGTTWMPEFAAAGALADLTADLADYPELAADNFFDGTVTSTQFDGKTVGVPWLAETRVLFYRTDVLQSVGYDHAPKTWDELLDASKKLTERGKDKYGIGLDPKEPTLSFMFARQNGSKLIEDGKAQFDQPAFAETVRYLDGYFKNGYAPVDLGLDTSQTFGGDGMVPMFISGPWMIKTVADQIPDIEGKWATAVLPSKDGNMSSLGGSNLSVFGFTEQKAAAMKFIAFLSKPENQLEWMKQTGELPANKKAWEDPQLSGDPNMAVVGEQLKNAEPMPLVKAWDNISQNFLKTFEEIYRADADIDAKLKDFNEQSQKLLDK